MENSNNLDNGVLDLKNQELQEVPNYINDDKIHSIILANNKISNLENI